LSTEIFQEEWLWSEESPGAGWFTASPDDADWIKTSVAPPLTTEETTWALSGGENVQYNAFSGAEHGNALFVGLVAVTTNVRPYPPAGNYPQFSVMGWIPRLQIPLFYWIFCIFCFSMSGLESWRTKAFEETRQIWYFEQK